MGNFQLPKTTAFDSAGDPVIGAKLYFYITQTSTPANTYQDELNTIANTNPVIADSAGRFVDIFLDTDIVYKVVLKDSADVTIYTVDPVKPYGIVNTEIPDRLRQVASNPLDYGAVGDGLLNEAVPVQTAINNATGTVDLLGKIYRCDSAINVPANRRVINGTLNFAQCPTAGPLVNVSGSLGASVALTANVNCNDSQVNLANTASLSAGMYVLLSSTVDFAASYKTGEVARIKSVSPLFVTLESGVRFSYASVNSSFRVINTVSNVEFQDVTVIGGNAAIQDGIRISYGNGVSIHNATVSNVSKKGIAFVTSTGCHVDVSRVNDIFLTDGTGISIDGGSSAISVNQSVITDAMIGVATEGALYINTGIHLNNLSIKGSTNHGIFLDKSTYDSSISGCDINGGEGALSNGISSYGTNCDIVGNKVRGCRVDGIAIVPSQTAVHTTSVSSVPPSKTAKKYKNCRYNSIDMVGRYGITVAASATNISGAIVTENRITNTGSEGIYFEASSTNYINDSSVINNVIHAPSVAAISMKTLSTSTMSGLNIAGNIITDLSSSAIGIDINSNTQNNIVNTIVSSNAISQGVGIRSTKCSGVVINSNSLSSPANEPIWLTSCNGVTVSGNNVIFSPSKGLVIDGVSSDINISSNSIEIADINSVNPCISASSVSNLSINGNTLKGSSKGIALGSGNNSDISNNKIINGGALAIDLASMIRTNVNGNSCTGYPAFMKVNQCTSISADHNTINVSNKGIEFLSSIDTSCNANSITNTNVFAISTFFNNTTFINQINGNRISKLGGDGILIECGILASVRGLLISNNNSVGLGADAIKINMQGGFILSPTITGNVLRTQSARCINVTVGGSAEIYGLSMSGNNVTGGTACAILINSTRANVLETNKITLYNITGNTISLSTGGNGIEFTGLSDSYVDGFISGNLLNGTNSAGDCGIKAYLPSPSGAAPQIFDGLIVGGNAFYNFSAGTEILANLRLATQLVSSSSGFANLKDD